jgi:hypothetical protein
MFVDEGASSGVTAGARRLVDHERGLTFAPQGVWWGPVKFFALTIGERVVCVETRHEGGAHRVNSEPQLHIVVTALGSTPLSEKLGYRAIPLSAQDAVEAFAFAAEALLVFGWWFDGLQHPDRYFVVRSELESEHRSFVLSRFGYTGAEWLPLHSKGLDFAAERRRRVSDQAAWGQDPIDAALTRYLDASPGIPRTARPDAEQALASVAPRKRAAILDRVQMLAEAGSVYARALEGGQAMGTVLAEMEAAHPGFSGESYRRSLARTAIGLEQVRIATRERRERYVREARLRTLRDGVFFLRYRNRRHTADLEPDFDIHAELGDLHSAADITAAIAQADQLINDGCLCGPDSDANGERQRLVLANPGFSEASVSEAALWGAELNR